MIPQKIRIECGSDRRFGSCREMVRKMIRFRISIDAYSNFPNGVKIEKQVGEDIMMNLLRKNLGAQWAKNQASRSAQSILVLSLLIVLSGCGLTLQQKANVKNFSAATMDFANLTGEEFAKSREDVIAMNKFRVIRFNDDSVDTTKLDGNLTVERAKIRIDAVNALRNYAELLQALAETSQKEELKSSTDSFIAGARKIEGVTLSDSEADAISSTVQALAGFFIECKRAQAICEVIEIADEHIMIILEEIEKDFARTGEAWSLEYENMAEGLRGKAVLHKQLNAGNDAAISVANEGLVLADSNKVRFLSISDQIIAAIDPLREAQKDLSYSLQSKEVTVKDIDLYISQIEDLVEKYKLIREDGS
jgi:hypothetical protein